MVARRFALVCIIAIPALIGSGAAQAQNVQPVGDYYAQQDSPAAPAAATPDPAPVANMDCCPKCGGGCNKCGCDNCGCCFVWDRDTWVKVGAGLRATFNAVEQHAGGDDIRSNYFNPDNMRLYFNGQGHKYIGFEYNTEIFDPNQTTFTTPNNFAELRTLDAIIKFQYSDLVNVWFGRLLPPSDRANLDGPFFLNAWDFPFVSNYPNIFQGRDNGVAYWGQLGGGTFKWQIGAFNGTGRTPGSSAFPTDPSVPNTNGDLLYAARFTLNLLDPEPGYYCQSTYYGKKDILAIGAVAMVQDNAVGTAAAPEKFFGWNLDFLFEKKLWNDGVFTFEAAYYNYDDHHTTTNISTLQGEAGYVEVSYLMADEIGCGKMCGRLQPFVRWQNYNYDNGFKGIAATAGAFNQGYDAGVNYIIAGHNARLTAFWGERDIEGGGNYVLFRTGAQLQF